MSGSVPVMTTRSRHDRTPAIFSACRSMKLTMASSGWRMSDPFSPERKTVCLEKQNLFGSGYAGLGALQRADWNHARCRFNGRRVDFDGAKSMPFRGAKADEGKMAS